MLPFRRLVLYALFACAFAAQGVRATEQEQSNPGDAETLAEKMLQHLGGRTAWAQLRGTINDSQQNRVDEPTVVRSVISMDFTAPRFRIDSTAPGLTVARAIDGERDWRQMRDGTVQPMAEDFRTEELRWYGGHVYRTLHRIAARDPAIRLDLAEDGRLQVFEGDRRIAWYRLDARGEPYAFGAHDDEQGAISGPWDFVQDGIRHPVWVSNRDGTWRARLSRLEINPALPDALFERPQQTAATD